MSRIEPRATWQLSELAEIWRYRELLWMLALRDLKIRYKQTAVGVAWAVLQPLVTLGLFGTLFNLLQAAPSSSGLPYALTTYCGLLPWQVFSSSVTLSARSLVTNQDLIRKVYFPRILVPAIPLVIGLIDFAIASTVLVAMMIAYQIEPTRAILLSPLFVGMTALAALGAGLWLSALNSLYRDVQQATPLLMQVLFFLSPAIYELHGFIPGHLGWLLALNPLTGAIAGFRWAVLGVPFDAPVLVISCVTLVVLVAGGFGFFRRFERTLADWL